MKKVAFHNLGCKVNSYEMEVMQQIVQKAGYEIVEFTQKADVYVINTCTVTNMADRKSRQMLHRAKQKNPEAVVVAAGCYAQTGLEDLKKDLSVDIIIGNNHKTEIAQILDNYFNEHSAGFRGEETIISDLSTPTDYEDAMLYDSMERMRADVKIQDGCNQFCSYCAIPLARGRVRSRKPSEIIEEIGNLVSNGHKEIVLTGIHISSYGIDFDDKAWEAGEVIPSKHESAKSGEMMRDYNGDSKLIDLAEMIAKMPENSRPERIRLGSLEPRIVTEENARRLANIPGLCPHFHMSLQSGCDATLARMNRHYTCEEFAESVDLLRNVFEKQGQRVAITTDVIVGFPGETEEEFAKTVQYLEELKLFEMHIFQYSRRKNTVADKLPNQISEDIKKKRSEVLLSMTERHSEEYRCSRIGDSATVLFEEYKDGYLVGHTDDYIRVVMNEEHAREKSIVPGNVTTVKMEKMLSDDTVFAL